MKSMDLSGKWLVHLAQQVGEPLPTTYEAQICLPGTTSAAGLGPENPARETDHLTDSHPFEGEAWYTRSFVADGWQGKQALLTLERTRMTSVYLDGKQVGDTCKSLCTPHRYLLPSLTDGEHQLTVRVVNTGYPTRGGHLTSPDTQSNWNGITGEISLTVGDVLITDMMVRPAKDLRSVHVSAAVLGADAGTVTAAAAGCAPVDWHFAHGRIDGDYPLPEGLAKWDELTPATHALSLTIGEDRIETTFGLRCFRAEGRRLYCNDREVFLRGRNDALVFPLTGYAPCDAASWRKVLETARAYGINHFRYHTCCPPEAAFAAADELGVFMEPELPFWGTVTEPGEEGYDAQERSFLIEEGFRILRAFGHHPSFVILSMGNELWGSKAALNRMMADYRAFDPDKLYISGSNNFQFVPDVLAEEDAFVGVRFSQDRLIRGSYATCDGPRGIVQLTEPESVTNYDRMILPDAAENAGQAGKVLIQYGTGVKEVEAQAAETLIPHVPVIAHEVGQYEFYPDFSEIDRYTGPLKARNMEVFRERLMAAGLYPQHERFFRAAGKLAVACYRREIETFLRSRELSGFQLLDLQDFSGQGTALVGVLNAMMQSKGLITPEEWRRFCAGTVVLGEFERFVLESGAPLTFGVRVSECDPARTHEQVTCTLLRGEQTLNQVTVPLGRRDGRLTDAVQVDLGPVDAAVPEQLAVRLMLADGTVNVYPIWVFPRCEVTITPEAITLDGACVRIVPDLDAARKTEGPVVVVPSAEGKLPAEYCTDFWCYSMFRSISESMGKPVATGTLGLCIDPTDPALAAFPSDEYTTPPWYRILAHAHCEPITDAEPVAEMIDNTERCQRLGVLYRQDGILHLTARLWEDAASPEVKWFASSIAKSLITA